MGEYKKRDKFYLQLKGLPALASVASYVHVQGSSNPIPGNKTVNKTDTLSVVEMHKQMAFNVCQMLNVSGIKFGCGQICRPS